MSDPIATYVEQQCGSQTVEKQAKLSTFVLKRIFRVGRLRPPFAVAQPVDSTPSPVPAPPRGDVGVPGSTMEVA